MKEWGLKEPGWVGVPYTMRERKDWRERSLRANDQGFLDPVSFWMPAAAAAAAAKSLQSCPTLCDPTDGLPPGSPVPGILQARTLEWVAISFSNA